MVRPGQQDVQGDLVRGLLAAGPLDQGDHAVEEGLARLGGDAHDDLVGQDPGAAGDRRAVAARLPDHRGRLAGDGRLVDRGDALDDLAVARGSSRRPTTTTTSSTWSSDAGDRPRSPVGRAAVGHRLGAGLAQGVGLGLAPALGHGLGEVGEQDGEPQPRRHQAGEQVLVARCDRRRSRRKRIVVRTLPTSTTNMTGLRAMRRGSSLRKLSPAAGRRMAGSNSDRLRSADAESSSRGRVARRSGPRARTGK